MLNEAYFDICSEKFQNTKRRWHTGYNQEVGVIVRAKVWGLWGEFYSSFLLLYVFKNEMSTLKCFMKVSSNLNINFVSLWPSSHLPRAHTPDLDSVRAEGLWSISSVLAWMALCSCFSSSYFSSADAHISCSLEEGRGWYLGEEERQRRKSYPDWP